MNFIYRDVSIPRMSKDACANFIRAVAISRGTITSNFSLSNGFTEKQVQYQSMFFRARFSNESELNKFESFGIKTSVPGKISGQKEDLK